MKLSCTKHRAEEAQREGALLTRVGNCGADELAGDVAANQLAKPIFNGAGDAAHEHHVPLELEVHILVVASQVADVGDLSDVSQHLRFYFYLQS